MGRNTTQPQPPLLSESRIHCNTSKMDHGTLLPLRSVLSISVMGERRGVDRRTGIIQTALRRFTYW